MKVVISAEGAELDAPLAANFARAAYFLVVDVDTLAYEALANPWTTARGGAGFEAARMVAGQAAQAVVTGLIGPNAYAALHEAGIPVFAAPAGTVRAALQAYRAAHLLPLAGPNAPPHAPFSRQEIAHANLDARRPARRRRRGTAEREDDVAELRARVQALAAEVAALRERVVEAEARGGQH